MVKNARLFLSVILLAAVPVPGWAQDAKAILNAAAHAMGAENLKTVQYTGSGSIYDEKGQHIVVSSYAWKMDLNAITATGRMVQMQGTPPVPQTVSQTIVAASPWSDQFGFWLTPYGFLKGAMTNDATAETKNVNGETYNVVTFTVPGNHKIVGYINNKDLVERVETRTENDILVQAFYHDYEDFGGLKVPTVIVNRRNGDLVLVLIVREAKPNA